MKRLSSRRLILAVTATAVMTHAYDSSEHDRWSCLLCSGT